MRVPMSGLSERLTRLSLALISLPLTGKRQDVQHRAAAAVAVVQSSATCNCLQQGLIEASEPWTLYIATFHSEKT